MSDSKREQILDNVVTTLKGITTVGGYNNTVADAVREIKQVSEVKSFPHINIFAGPGRKSWNTNLEVREEFQIGVQAIIKGQRQPGTADYLPALVEQMIQDIDNALLADIHRGHADWVEMTVPVLVDPVIVWHELKAVIDMVYSVNYFYTAGTA